MFRCWDAQKYAYFHLLCRQPGDIVKGPVIDKIPSVSDLSTINRRINRLDTKIDDKNAKELKDRYIIIAIDSKGIKATIRCQWMKKKWGILE